MIGYLIFRDGGNAYQTQPYHWRRRIHTELQFGTNQVSLPEIRNLPSVRLFVVFAECRSKDPRQKKNLAKSLFAECQIYLALGKYLACRVPNI